MGNFMEDGPNNVIERPLLVTASHLGRQAARNAISTEKADADEEVWTSDDDYFYVECRDVAFGD